MVVQDGNMLCFGLVWFGYVGPRLLLFFSGISCIIFSFSFYVSILSLVIHLVLNLNINLDLNLNLNLNLVFYPNPIIYVVFFSIPSTRYE